MKISVFITAQAEFTTRARPSRTFSSFSVGQRRKRSTRLSCDDEGRIQMLLKRFMAVFSLLKTRSKVTRSRFT